MQPVRKASENIYSSQSGLKQRKTRIPRCSSPTTLSQNSQLHSLHGGHGCLTNMTSQIHEITNSRKRRHADHEVNAIPKIRVPQLQYPVSQIHALNVGHDCLTSMTYQILKYADSQIRSPRFTDLQISLPRIMYLRIPSHRFTTSRIFTKVMVVCLTSMTLQIPRAQFISLRPKKHQNIRNMSHTLASKQLREF